MTSQQPQFLSQNADAARDNSGSLTGTRIRKAVSALRMEIINPAPTTDSH